MKQRQGNLEHSSADEPLMMIMMMMMMMLLLMMMLSLNDLKRPLLVMDRLEREVEECERTMMMMDEKEAQRDRYSKKKWQHRIVQTMAVIL
jgi:hypothetical protein